MTYVPRSIWGTDLDWGSGRYETTALELEPAARRVIELAQILPGERALDLACGTGNAALPAAEAGATVAGLDASQRLVGVAAARAAATRPLLEQAGTYDEVRGQVISALAAHNEDPSGLRLTSHYVIAEIRPTSAALPGRPGR